MRGEERSFIDCGILASYSSGSGIGHCLGTRSWTKNLVVLHSLEVLYLYRVPAKASVSLGEQGRKKKGGYNVAGQTRKQALFLSIGTTS